MLEIPLDLLTPSGSSDLMAHQHPSLLILGHRCLGISSSLELPNILSIGIFLQDFCNFAAAMSSYL